jgi:hypothetical protein
MSNINPDTKLINYIYSLSKEEREKEFILAKEIVKNVQLNDIKIQRQKKINNSYGINIFNYISFLIFLYSIYGRFKS